MRRLLLVICLSLAATAARALDVQIVIQGLDSAQETNVRAFLSLEREKDREELTEGRLRLLHREAPDEIRQSLRPFGLFKPEIEADLQTTQTGYRAEYRVTPGPRIRLSGLRYEVAGQGREDPRFAAGPELREGEFLDQARYDSEKQKLLGAAVSSGYLDARFSTHELTVDLDRYQASIHLVLDTGPRYRFGEVRFQQEQLDEAFLRRYLRFQPGDPFNHEQLLDLQARLIDSEYFSHVEVRSLRDEAEGDRVPIELILSPNKRNRYRAGLGFATDTGPRITLDWKRRLIGREGHRMNAELRLSAPHSSLLAEYQIPLERPSRDSLSFAAQAEHFDTDSRRGQRYLLNSAKTVGLERDWRRAFGLDYSFESFSVGDQDDEALLLVPYASWSRLRSDGKDYIRRGVRVNFRVEGAAEQLLSSVSYLQVHSDDKIIHGLGDGRWRLLARATLGATWTSSLTDLPASKRFFAGGDNSVRGFGLDEIGPRDASGDVIGGRFLAVASIEVERLIVDKWSAALFFDAGNAFDPDYDARIEYSAGIGVRWHSPVGPIRVDVATALSKDEPSLRLHVVVGPEL
jgi:translocation and assembly module TamA